MGEYGIQIESWGPFAEGKNDLFSNPVLSEIAAAHAKSVGQVVLRWLIQRGVVIIPKSVRPERMRENIDIFDFELTAEEMARVAGLDTGAFAGWRTTEKSGKYFSTAASRWIRPWRSSLCKIVTAEPKRAATWANFPFVDSLLRDSAYKESARAVSEELRALPGAEYVADLAESVPN